MTRRERLERKAALRQEWADKREQTANSLLASTAQFRGDHAFNTQPGHIPERARVIKREERAFENMQVAQHHTEKARGIEAQLDRSIFSDDENAIADLEERIEERERERERIKAFNVSCRKGTPDESLLDEAQRKDIASIRRVCFYQLGKHGEFPGYALSNLSGRIKGDKDRIKAIRSRMEQQQAAENAGGVLIRRFENVNWCNVTFAEKPEKSVIDALKSAGYGWGNGSWGGYLDKLPEMVAELGNGQV